MTDDGKPMKRPRTTAIREGRIYQRRSDGRWVGVVWPPGQGRREGPRGLRQDPTPKLRPDALLSNADRSASDGQ